MNISLKAKVDIGLKILRYKIYKKKIPISVSLNLSNRCNFNCVYCDFDKKDKIEQNTKEVLKCIDSFYRMGTRRIGFSGGGEPFIRDDIRELVSFCKSKNMVVSMTSNGWLTRERMDVVKLVDLMVFSLDGKEECHDTQRKRGSFGKVLESIDLCKKYGTKVWTMTVLTKSSIKDVDFLIELGRDRGFELIFQPVENTNAFDGCIDLYKPGIQEFRDTINRLIEAKKAGAPIAVSYGYLKTLLHWPDINSLKWGKRQEWKILLLCGKNILQCSSKRRRSPVQCDVSN